MALLNYPVMFRNIPILIGFLFSYLVYHILRIQIINKYSPAYRYVSDILSQLILFIIDLISIKPSYDYVWLYILVILLYVMIIIGMLVYQEVIVIHLWGLDENTTNIIKRRVEMDENNFESIIEESLNTPLDVDKVKEEEENKEVDISLNNIN